MNVQTKSQWQAKCRKNTLTLALWTALWLISLALVKSGSVKFWPETPLLTWVAAGLNLVLGCVMIWANKRYLEGLDELQQKIQLQAMGITLGAGLVLGVLFDVAEQAGILPFAASISNLIVAMALVYIAALVIGARKYA